MNDGIMDDFASRYVYGNGRIWSAVYIRIYLDRSCVQTSLARGGRTREGFQVYNPEDTPGDKATVRLWLT